MARTRTPQKDILARVTDLGSEALSRLGEIPGGQKLAEMAHESRSRLDEMQKKLRGLDALERRVAKLERQLSASTAKRPATSAAKTTAKRPATSAAKPPAKTPRAPAARKTTARKAAAPKKPPA